MPKPPQGEQTLPAISPARHASHLDEPADEPADEPDSLNSPALIFDVDGSPFSSHVGRFSASGVDSVIVLINGSFGVGKTTVAKLLREAFPGSVVYDPEWAGLALMRLPKWIKFKGSGSDDFQDIALWRKSAVAGVRLFSRFSRGHVIVPMTFSQRDYFDEVTVGIKLLNLELRVFCLKASLQTIKKRLAGRGTKSAEAGWIERRIIECAEAHRDAHFGEPVETENRPAPAVAEEIIQRLQQPGATTVA